ncbi:glycosyltransferase family 39 protein [Clostridium oryzae]|nr:glycosyltransferase family 39 protein [Clostridium oryzae]
MPGVSYILAFLMKLFGEFGGITAFRVLQAMLQSISLYLMFLIGRKIFNTKVAITAVILDTFCIAEIWTPNLVLTETFFKFFVMLLVLFSLEAIEKNELKYYLIGGLFWGLAALFRPTIALYPVLILIMWVINKVKLINCIKYALVTTIVFSAVLCPWWIRNYNIFHKFIPFTLATGNPMLQGTYINYDQSSRSTDGLNYKQFDYSYKDNSEQQQNNVEIAISKYRLENLFPKHPIKFILWYTLGKAWWQINYPFYWKQILGVNFIEAALYHAIIILLSIFGIVKFIKSKSKNKLALLPMMVILYFIVVYLPFFTMGRYFFPAMPYVLMFSAYGLLYLGDRYGIVEVLLKKVKKDSR